MPVKCYKSKTIPQPYCWKECGQEGTFLHCWWSCPPVKNFWSHILSNTEWIIGQQPPENLAAILLHDWENWNVLNNTKQLAAVLLSAAKTLIALQWKSTEPPQLAH